MKKVQPTFLTLLSSFSVPIVIIPAEDRDVPGDAAQAGRHRPL